MTASRVFLGWDQPILPSAGDWLLDRFGSDLSGVTVAVPVRRAGRRLIQLLAQRTGGLMPPRVVTPGELPGVLGADAPRRVQGQACRPIDERTAVLARARVMREQPELARELHPNLPAMDDVPAWVRLANSLQQIQRSLALGVCTVSDMQARDDLPSPTANRWQAFARLERAVDDTLAQAGAHEPQRARVLNIRDGGLELPGPLVTVGLADLRRIESMAIQPVAANTTALIFAPAEHAEGFDELGGLVREYWLQQTLHIPDDAIRLVARTSDLPSGCIEAVAQAIDAGSAQSRDDVSLGLTHEPDGPAVARALDQTGAPTRLAARGSLLQTSPGVLLSRLVRWLEQPDALDAFSDLLRHPAIDQALHRDESLGDGPRAWHTMLNRYRADTLAGRLIGDWLKHPLTDQLQSIHHAVRRALPESPEVAGPLPQWAEPLAQWLTWCYPPEQTASLGPEAQGTAEALTSLAATVQSMAKAEGPDSRFAPEVTFAQAVELILDAWQGENHADPPGSSCVEAMGWLDLALDDAPSAVVVGLHEGQLPASSAHDAWLPDALRQATHLPTAEDTLARDAYLMQALLKSRRFVRLLLAQRGVEGEPMTPSRLLLRGLPRSLPERVLALMDDNLVPEPPPARLAAQPNPVPPGFVLPYPDRAWPKDQPLRASDFALYRRCPYRFYLKRVLKLRPTEVPEPEMNPMVFGVLAHRCLDGLAKRSLQTPSFDWLGGFSRLLDEHANEAFGHSPPSAVRVQLDALRDRLQALASMQHDWITEGWSVIATERPFELRLNVDLPEQGQAPVIVHGTIDRIDRHPQLGLRLVDYKVSDSKTPSPPEETHRTKDDQGQTLWQDFQLPMYDRMVREALHADALPGAIGLSPETPIQTGYITVARNPDEVDWHAADWDALDLSEADRQRDEIIHAIFTGPEAFWPPAAPTGLDDGFNALCGDTVAQRQAWLDASQAAASLVDGSGA